MLRFLHLVIETAMPIIRFGENQPQALSCAGEVAWRDRREAQTLVWQASPPAPRSCAGLEDLEEIEYFRYTAPRGGFIPT